MLTPGVFHVTNFSRRKLVRSSKEKILKERPWIPRRNPCRNFAKLGYAGCRRLPPTAISARKIDADDSVDQSSSRKVCHNNPDASCIVAFTNASINESVGTFEEDAAYINIADKAREVWPQSWVGIGAESC